MLIVFVSNFLNLHQLPTAEAFLAAGIDFRFIATTPTPKDSKISDGVEMNDKYPFVVKAYESEAKHGEAMKLIADADVLIAAGYHPRKEINKRSKEGKITFIYTERPFRSFGITKESFKDKVFYFLRFIRNYKNYRRKNIYFLAASAYLKEDLNRYAKNNRPIYKWGYFPPVPNINKDIVANRRNEVPELVFCARFIELKNPLMAIKTSEALLKKGYKNHLTMIGDGDLLSSCKQYIKDRHLEECVSFLGNVPSSKVPEEMIKGDIFLFPSNRSEGWGAVLNESMSLGLVPVVSNTIGSAPFLIKDGVNGLLFEEENLDDMVKKTEMLIKYPEKRKEMSLKAYERIHDEYNAKVAISRFLKLVESIKKGEPCPYEEGVCSLS